MTARRIGTIACVALGLACGSPEPEPPPPSPAPGTAAATTSEVAATETELALPPPGQVRVEVGPKGTLVLANQASRREVLEAIARNTGLLVVSFVGGGDPGGLVSVRSEGESIEVVVARVLGGVAYAVEPLEPGARVSLVVGRGAEATTKLREARVERKEQRRPARIERERSPLDEDESLRQLESRDPEERVEGVEWLDVTSATGYDAAIDRLANDPDPTVRAAAAESLGDADVGAVPPLVRALSDADPRVVLSALESLELLGDASTISKLEPALRHGDPEVRERAAEVAEFLE